MTSMTSGDRASHHRFLGVSVLLFAASALVTIRWSTSMSSMNGMEMPGGWTMSMAWMRMPGQSWPGAAASFLGMWITMMGAMMLPSLARALWRYRRAVARTGEPRLGRMTLLAGVGYFVPWTAVGLVAFALGVSLASLEMALPALSRAAPVATGLLIVLAGALQLTSWKARRLACCRASPACAGPPLQYGLRLGLQCSACCAGLTAILLVVGAMDLRAMALVTAAITAERFAGERVARMIGGAAIAAGALLIAQAAGLA